jgi:hypothetical protein
MSRARLAALGWALAAGALALGCDTGTSSDPAEGAAITAPGSDEPRPPIEEVLREPDPFARAARLATLLPALGPEAVPEARIALKAGSHLGSVEQELLVRYWATHDPESATQWATVSSPLGYRLALTVVAVELWARADPERALKQVQALGPGRGPNLEAAEIALVRGWFDSGDPGLWRYIRDLGLTNERQRALGIFARKMIQRDGPDAIVRWTEAIPDVDQRFKLAAFRQLASELTQWDPAAGVAWCDAHCEGPFGDNVREMVATRWAARDGLPAMRWLSTAPEGKSRDEAVRAAFRSWQRKDPEGLFQWMTERGIEASEEAWFRPVVGLYAMAISWEDPLGALEWAERIEDEEKRKRAVVTILRRWRDRDEAAAEAWLERSSLSEEAREEVRAPAPQRIRRPAARQDTPESEPGPS